MAKVKALGTTITFNSLAIGGLTSIGEVSVTSDEIDTTSLDSADGYKEVAQGIKDAGEVPLTGFYVNADVGQVGLRTGFGTGDVDAVVITYPDDTTVSGNAFVKGFAMGPAEVNGAIGFSATLRFTGAVDVE
jgi:predicted secreted protein